MHEKPGARTKIVKVEKTPEGGAGVVARNDELGKGTLVPGGNIYASESPEFVAHLEELAAKNGTTVEAERQKDYDSIADW